MSRPSRFRSCSLPARLCAATVVASGLACLSLPSRAETVPPLQGVVTLSASATIEVPRDLLSVALGTTREGADAATVQSQLKQALDAALTEARKVASPGQLEVRTGNFSLSPRYNGKGAANGWQGSTELVIEGRDLQAIGQLTGRITTLVITRVGYDISRDLREKSEAQVSAEAIARYRARAADYATKFGYGSYAIREVEVTTGDSGSSQPRPMMAMKVAAPVTGNEPLPTEAGKANVTVSVSGSVQMNR